MNTCSRWETNRIYVAINTHWRNRDVLAESDSVFLVQELLTYGTIYLLTQQTLAVYASSAHQLVQATCLGLVQFILSDSITVWTLFFSAYCK